jgi:hypothetical protein
MIYYLILFIFLAAFFVLAIRRIDWAVMLIVAGLPLYLVRFKLLVPFTLLEAMILIAFFCWLVSKTRFWDFLRGKYSVKDMIDNSPWKKRGSAEGRRKYPFGIELVLLLIVSLVAAGVAHFSVASLGLWKAYFLEPALLYILILNIFQDKNGVNKIGLALAAGALAVSAYAIFQKFTGIGIDNPLWAAAATRRAVSFFGYPNAVGLYLGPIIPVLFGFLLLPAKKECTPFEEKICYPLLEGAVVKYRFGLNLHILVNFFKNVSSDISISPSTFLKKFPQNLKDLFSKSIRRQIPGEKISAIGLSKAFLGFIILLSLAAIYFAKSDGALIGLAAAAFVFCLFANKKARIAAIIIVLVASAGIYFYPPVEKPLIRKITAHDLSGQIRRLQWRETLMMLNGKTEILGAGLGNYQQAVAPYHQPGFFYDDGTDPNFHQHTIESAAVRAATWQPVEIYLYPHDIILNFWSELGLAGLILFIWIIIKFSVFNFKFSIKENKYKYLHLGLLAAMIVIVVHGLVDVPYFKNDLSALFWIIVAMLAIISEKNKNLPPSARKA